MPLRWILPTLLLVLAATGCGDDEEPGPSGAAPSVDGGLADQADALLSCTTDQALPGSLGMAEGGILAVDLTTETETILVHLLPSEAEAAEYQNSAGLDQEQVANAVILGGAISPDHRAVIVECLERS